MEKKTTKATTNGVSDIKLNKEVTEPQILEFNANKEKLNKSLNSNPNPKPIKSATDIDKALEKLKKDSILSKARFVQKEKKRKEQIKTNKLQTEDDEETNQNSFIGSRIKDPPMFSSFISTKEEVNEIKFNKNLFDTLIKKSESFNS